VQRSIRYNIAAIATALIWGAANSPSSAQLVIMADDIGKDAQEIFDAHVDEAALPHAMRIVWSIEDPRDRCASRFDSKLCRRAQDAARKIRPKILSRSIMYWAVLRRMSRAESTSPFPPNCGPISYFVLQGGAEWCTEF
jgi:hypothetical protein